MGGQLVVVAVIMMVTVEMTGGQTGQTMLAVLQ
jgi:hypothetical protein